MMRRFQGLPGASAAIGAFVLTVLLGFGGASASALWQQSATATMTVTAAANWPGSAVSSVTCLNDSPQKTATLSVSAPRTLAALTYGAVQANGSIATAYSGSEVSVAGSTGSITLTGASQIIRDNFYQGRLTVRVIATYSDQTQASSDIVLSHDTSNGKIYCP